METRIVAVGNSHGLRIPKALLEQARLAPGDKVRIGVESGRLIVEGARAPRERVSTSVTSRQAIAASAGAAIRFATGT